MRVGETLIEAMRGLPAIAGQQSVDVIYAQICSERWGAEACSSSTRCNPHAVELEELPDDVVSEASRPERTFPELTLALRLRTSYDPVNRQLQYKGILVEPADRVRLWRS